MKKQIYIIPTLTVVRVDAAQMVAESPSTNVPGLGFSDEPYEDGGRVKRESFNVWNDDWSN